MSAHDAKTSIIDRLAEHAFADVMDRLHLAVRAAVTTEVDAELAHRTAELDLWENRIIRMEQARLTPRLPPNDIVRAASKIAAASIAVEQTQYCPGERNARERLDKAIMELREAINNQPHSKI